VFGNSGVVTCNQQSYLNRIYNEVLFNNLQNAALPGTIEMLRSAIIGHILRFTGISNHSVQLCMCFSSFE